MKAPNSSTIDNNDDSETSGVSEQKSNNNKTAHYTQAATGVANGIEQSVIQ